MIAAAVQRRKILLFYDPLFQYIMMEITFTWPLGLDSLSRYSKFLTRIHISKEI